MSTGTSLSWNEIESRVMELRGELPESVISAVLDKLRKLVDDGIPISPDELETILRMVKEEYEKCIVEPGEPVGTVAAQSLGEPSTQMTLRTFHYAGVRELNVTLGLPRLIEIVDARKTPSTPMMTVYLDEEHKYDKAKALEVARRIEMTRVENIAKSVDVDLYTSSIIVKLDPAMLSDKGVTVEQVKKALEKVKAGRIVEGEDEYTLIIELEGVTDISKMQKIRDKVLNAKIKGVKGIKRVIVQKRGNEYVLITDGSNLASVLNVKGVDPRRTITNNIHEVESVLGIEAARAVIIKEIMDVLEDQGLDVDIRHVMIVADIMTRTGRVRQIGRHGVSGEKESVLARAAFEVTVRHLLDAAARGEYDDLKGVAENVIVGQVIPVGTGMVDLYMKPVAPKPTTKTPESGGE